LPLEIFRGLRQAVVHKPAYTRLITFVLARLVATTIVIAYRKLTDYYTNKIDECAAVANELIALKDKVAKSGSESDS
jgi:hypothetical protein